MRRLWIILGAAIALLAGAFLALPWLVNANQFRPLLKSELEQALRRPVELGALSLTVFPLALEASDLVIGEDPAFGGERPFARAQKLAVKVDLFGLFRRQVHVESLRITNPLVELIRRADGKWNVDSLTASDGSPSTLKLAEVRIDGGRLALRTPTQARAEYQNIDVMLRDFAAGRKSPVTVTARMPGVNNGALSFDGTVAGAELEGEVAVKDCALPALEAALGRPLFAGTKVSGLLTGQAKVKSGAQGWRAAGELALRSAVAGGVKLEQGLAADYQVSAEGELVKLEVLKVKIGPLDLRLSGTVTGDRLALKVNAADAPITELARLAAGFGVAFAPGMEVRGVLGTNLTISGTKSAPAFTGQVHAAQLEIRGGDLKHPVRTANLVIDLTPESLRASPFAVQTDNTKLSGTFSLAGYSSAQPQLEASVTVPPSSLGDLVDMAQAYGVAAARGVKATGQAAIEAKVYGGIGKGGRLQYRGTGRVTGATIHTPALTQPVTVRTASLRFEGDAAGVEGLDATVGQTSLTGRIASRGDSLDFALAADKVDVDELRRLIAPAPSEPKSAGPAGQGSLTVGSLKMDRLLLTNVQTNVTLTAGQIRFDPLTANLYGGTHTGTILVDQRAAQPVYTLDSKLDKIDSTQLLAAVSSLKQLVGGPLSARAKLTVTPRPNEEMIKSLDGTLGLSFTEGKLYSMNLLGEIGNLAQFLKKASPDKYTSFLALTGELKLANGIANTDNLKLDLDNATVTMAGLMNLVDQSLNLKLRTLLNRKLAEEVGGSRIGGYLTAAVGGPNGDMTIPSLVTGTFLKPRFAPDTAAMARLKVQSATKDPGAVVEAIKGKEGMQGLINIFKGKKKEASKPENR